jgi:hypothetical protein
VASHSYTSSQHQSAVRPEVKAAFSLEPGDHTISRNCLAGVRKGFFSGERRLGGDALVESEKSASALRRSLDRLLRVVGVRAAGLDFAIRITFALAFSLQLYSSTEVTQASPMTVVMLLTVLVHDLVLVYGSMGFDRCLPSSPGIDDLIPSVHAFADDLKFLTAGLSDLNQLALVLDGGDLLSCSSLEL